MVSSNKVLTVSYGTFSCTLEGFDESFDTMKAIAEYFRDLAADDRYFGAEPPTPDADMLARIAEREISRRVKAHEEGGQIVLRAGDTEAFLQAGSTTAEPTHASPPRTDGYETSAPPHAAPAGPQQPSAAPKGAPAQDETPSEPAGPAPSQATPAPAAAEPAADQSHAAEPETMAPAADDTPEATAPDRDTAATAPESHGSEEPRENSVEPTVEEPAGDAVEDEDSDSVSARLRRIRSVVEQGGGDYGTGEFSEDEHANDFLAQTAAELNPALERDEAEGTAQEAAPREPAPQAQAETAPEDISAAEPPEDPFASLTARLLQEYEPDPAAEPRADITPDDDAEAEARQDETVAEDTLSQLLADAMPETTLDVPDADAAEAPLVLGEHDETGEIPAPEVGLEEGAQDDANLFDEDHDETESQDLLSPEEEAELQRELAAVEAELGAGSAPELDDSEIDHPEVATATAPAAETAPDQADTTEDHRADRLRAGDESADVSRLFDEADSQLEAPEASKRRNAIQHLRAAVAATKAEKNAGSDLREEQSDAPYRSDLAEVVRPRRPHTSREPSHKERPRARRPAEEDRPAPLKLVAEQRIDTPHEPVRPRRVSAAPVPSGSASGGKTFEEYAAEIGATTLHELLEAAAAYMSDVEGRDQFSRPMLMGKIKEIDNESFTREDGLRSFGHLLRQGKLQKLKGGRFAITEHTEFRARARHAG